jgi:hypothetical protein
VVVLGVYEVIVDEFLRSQERFDVQVPPEMDPFLDEGALDGAYVLDIRFDALRSRAWMLFDCRGALQVVTGNTAVLVVNEVRSFSWADNDAPKPRRQRSVGVWRPSSANGNWAVHMGFESSSHLLITGSGGEFFVGDIPGGDDAPPDFMTATEEEMRAGLAGWSSEFRPINASFRDFKNR